jgi:hypothetical protein
MNPIEDQRQVIEKLRQLVHQSAPHAYTEAACRFRYFREADGSRAVDEQFWYYIDEQRVSAFLNDDVAVNPMQLVADLHAQMKTHTGGDWHALTLTIQKDGRVTTKFEYPEREA